MALSNGFKEHLGAAIIYLALAVVLRGLRNQYIVGKHLLS